MLETSEDIALQSREIPQTFVCWSHKLAQTLAMSTLNSNPNDANSSKLHKSSRERMSVSDQMRARLKRPEHKTGLERAAEMKPNLNSSQPSSLGHGLLTACMPRPISHRFATSRSFSCFPLSLFEEKSL